MRQSAYQFPHQTPAVSSVVSDSDYNANDEEDEDEEYERLDDDDFTLESGRKTRSRAKRSSSGQASRMRRFETSDADDRVDDSTASSSDSDGDLLMDGSPAKLAAKRRRRSSQHPKKRRRTNSVPVDDEAFRSAGINSQTGVTQAEEAADASIPCVDQVLDYRVMGGKPKAGEDDGPYTDFRSPM
ncbi:hypothetical protein FGB62_33g02 [Gracilaria domingensis]|nr:hypothetical protein FGB62_33g02 [Gracilaria domingensis]